MTRRVTRRGHLVLKTSVAVPEPEPEPQDPYHSAAIRTGTVIFVLVPIPAPVPGIKSSKNGFDTLVLKGIGVGEQI
jgi:hypothetical protein